MKRFSLYVSGLLLVGLVVTGTPGYGTAEPPIASPPDALQNTTPSGFPPCPDPPPKTQAMPPTPNPDPTRPPNAPHDPALLVPGVGAPACDGSRFGVREIPGTLLPSGIVVPLPPGPSTLPCSVECQRMMEERKKELEKQGIKIN